jgi:predicted SAM-dependent methyltransferase
LSELLIGCGNSRTKKHFLDGPDWNGLVTIDYDPNCGADIIHDLDATPWPLDDDSFDNAYAFEVLEHLGRQGDWRAFFGTFAEIYRVLKPGGYLIATVPSWQSQWAWADPSHTRVIAPGSLVFLDQQAYANQVGKTPMTDFRHTWKCDFETVASDDNGKSFKFALKAHKPARF